MTSRRMVRVLSALLTLTLPPVALAAVEAPQLNKPYKFVTVDSFLVRDATNVELTGILEGESTPRTIRFYYASGNSSTDSSQHMSRCDRMALLAMNKPGLYLLELVQLDYTPNQTTCRLTRRAATQAP
ncbi:hypothetical protein LZ198_36500 [Myxococcus sp. K15C18031901]|uniref:hypothetical protein n=1 Tax=Myxococcus dinghuensis TaxID=2906761 RepID=UPI0020A6DDFD|nr:hypothetical protein [Myxococcus dinghuensis]MCP3104379.1 hypothetical protein [Myxococcus dinghuensis]